MKRSVYVSWLGALAIGAASSTLTFAQTFVGGTQISPSTSLASVSSFTINKIADGITSDAPPFNGFASQAAAGTITLDLDRPYNLGAFEIWNDINVFGEGIARFRLDFYDSLLALQGSSAVFQAPKGQVAPAIFSFAEQSNVQRVNLVVLDSNVGVFNRIEIREVGFFTSAVPEPSSFALLAAGLLGLMAMRSRRSQRAGG